MTVINGESILHIYLSLFKGTIMDNDSITKEMEAISKKYGLSLSDFKSRYGLATKLSLNESVFFIKYLAIKKREYQIERNSHKKRKLNGQRS